MLRGAQRRSLGRDAIARGAEHLKVAWAVDALEAIIDALVRAMAVDLGDGVRNARARLELERRLESLAEDERARVLLLLALAKAPNALTEQQLLMLCRLRKNPELSI